MLRCVSFRVAGRWWVWWRKAKVSAAIGAKLALGGCVGMRMDVLEMCDE